MKCCHPACERTNNSANFASTAPKRDFGKGTCKPNSVEGDHSSRRRVAADAQQRPTRRFRQWLEPPGRAGQARSGAGLFGFRFPPYLVLLRVGFTLPSALPPKRCALTAPFHPYLSHRAKPVAAGGIFSVALAVHGPSRPRPGRYPAHCPLEFGLSSPARLRLLGRNRRQRPPGPFASS